MANRNYGDEDRTRGGWFGGRDRDEERGSGGGGGWFGRNQDEERGGGGWFGRDREEDQGRGGSYGSREREWSPGMREDWRGFSSFQGGSQSGQGGYGGQWGSQGGQGRWGSQGGYGSQGDWGSGQGNWGSGQGNQGQQGQQGQWGGQGGYGGGSQRGGWGAGGMQGRESWEGPHSGRGPQGYQRSTESIREEVCEVLTRHGQIDASGIQVNVQDGEITLEGTVKTRREKRMVEDVLEGVSGVRDVHNRLRVDSGEHNGRDREQQAGGSTGAIGTLSTAGTETEAGRGRRK